MGAVSDSPVTDLVLREIPFDSPQAATLIGELQQEYVTRYGGPDNTPVDANQFSPPDGLFLVAEADGEAVGCVGLRPLPVDGQVCAEMKRMYVRAGFRRLGLGRRLLSAAEQRATLLGYPRLVLHTGTLQPEAVTLYRNAGYLPIAGFGVYAHEPQSLYFAKSLT